MKATKVVSFVMVMSLPHMQIAVTDAGQRALAQAPSPQGDFVGYDALNVYLRARLVADPGFELAGTLSKDAGVRNNFQQLTGSIDASPANTGLANVRPGPANTLFTELLLTQFADSKKTFANVSGAHRTLDEKLIKVMGKPFDFERQESSDESLAAHDPTRYLHFPSVLNTVFELLGVSDEGSFLPTFTGKGRARSLSRVTA